MAQALVTTQVCPVGSSLLSQARTVRGGALTGVTGTSPSGPDCDETPRSLFRAGAFIEEWVMGIEPALSAWKSLPLTIDHLHRPDLRLSGTLPVNDRWRL